ncbi:MAG: type II toxin-antitoxin system VapB family antitoxin [Chitinophagales bacterium]
MSAKPLPQMDFERFWRFMCIFRVLFVYKINSMRTNIAIDDYLMETALKISGLKTKKAVVEAALKTFVRLEQQKQIKEWRGKLKWEGDLNQMRLDS